MQISSNTHAHIDCNETHAHTEYGESSDALEPSIKGMTTVEVTISRHNEAVVGTVKATFDMNLSEIRELISNVIQNVSARLQSQQALIGHIKAYASTEQGIAFSSTGEAVSITELSSTCCSVECVCIVMLVDESTLQTILEEELNAYLYAA